MNPSAFALSVYSFVGLIAVALFLSILAERARLPGAVLLVGAGIVAGSVWHRPPFDFSQTLLLVFLPPLIFEARGTCIWMNWERFGDRSRS
ncbi:MAG: cation:proton antiporter [Candidatus Eremiobacteraeota bacterium]|nr:cation:proton antiporter [Candidatus Eremiobacteraeota bacterium]